MDIVCHHTGTLNMFGAMQDWSGIQEFNQTDSTVYYVRESNQYYYANTVL